MIEMVKIIENYFTPEQMKKLKNQRELPDPDKIKEVENEWPPLITFVRKGASLSPTFHDFSRGGSQF